MEVEVPARQWWRRYALAMGAVAAAALAREALTPLVGAVPLTFTLFVPAVALTAWYGGSGPALFAVALAALTTDWLFLPPVHQLKIAESSDAAALAGFIVACLFIVGPIESLRRSRRRMAREIAARRRSEGQLADARDLLATTLASIGDAVIVADPDGRITFLNPEAERLSGWRRTDAEGRDLSAVFRIVSESTRQVVESPVTKAIRLGTVVGLANHTLLLSKDGRELAIDDSAAPIRRADGVLVGVVLVFRDVSERRAAEIARARLSAIVEFSGDAIVSKNLDGIVLTWNAAAQRIFGYTPDEIVGRPITVLFPPDRLDEEDRILTRIRAGRPFELFETIRIAKDGRPIPVSISISPLKNADGEIAGASKIIRDISEVVAARDALAREKARKDEFLAILSHELRNPLAPISMAVSMLRTIGPATVELAQLCDIIERQMRQLARLLDDLLDVSRIGLGKISLQTDRLSFAVVVSSAVETVRPILEARRHQLVLDVSSEPLEVQGDLGRLSQVVANLLNNAARYTEPGGRITLSLQRGGSDAVLRVRDTGIGLAPEQLPRIFELFAQVDKSLERGQGGLGVGLSLARTIVQLHGGRIEAQSEGLGRGSEFVVRLPLLPAAAAAPAAVEIAAAAPAPSSHYRILVADDNEDSTFVLASALRDLGHEVASAHDGPAALEVAANFHPDLAILDIGMPKLNGYEVARRLRGGAAGQGRRVALVAVTGWGQEDDKRRAREAGFDHHLTKPIELRTIQRLIAEL